MNKKLSYILKKVSAAVTKEDMGKVHTEEVQAVMFSGCQQFPVNPLYSASSTTSMSSDNAPVSTNNIGSSKDSPKSEVRICTHSIAL